MQCGSLLAEKNQEETQREETEPEESFELDDRILCPDGNCTGIIIDGRCSECGKPYADSNSDT